jgi:hypothetical protein
LAQLGADLLFVDTDNVFWKELENWIIPMA